MIFQLIQDDVFKSIVKVSIRSPKGGNLKDVPFLNPAEVDASSKVACMPLEMGYPVDKAAVPTAVCWESKNKPLPDAVMSHGIHLVSDEFREIVESLDPNVHQFSPVDVFRPKENVPFARRYWMVVCRRIDNTDSEKTTFNRHNGRLWIRDDKGKFVFNLEAIGRAHVWRDPFISGAVLFSSALAEKLNASQLSGFHLKPFEAQ